MRKLSVEQEWALMRVEHMINPPLMACPQHKGQYNTPNFTHCKVCKLKERLREKWMKR